MRELAAVVAAQDGEIAGLKAAPAPVVAPLVAPPLRPRSAGSPLRSRDPAEIGRRAALRRAAPPAHRSPPAAPWTPRALGRAEAPVRDPARDAALIAAFDAAGLEVHLQPVVSLPQRKVVSYEAVARLRLAGETLMPEAFLPVLERHGRTTDLDRRMLQRVATIARHLGRARQPGGGGLRPVAALPVRAGLPALRSARLVEGRTGPAGRVMLALPQASWRSLDAEQAGALADLRGRIGFILDRPLDLRLDPLALADRGVAPGQGPGRAAAAPGFAPGRCPTSRSRTSWRPWRGPASASSPTGVEHETDVPDLIDLDVPLAQGSVFAPARAVRAEVLSVGPGCVRADPAERGSGAAAPAPPVPRFPAPGRLTPGAALHFLGGPA